MMTNTDNNNYNIESIEVQAPPTITIMHDDASADDIEQLPIANDDHNEHVVVNYHASKKYIIGAAFGTVVASAAFFGVGKGAGSGITRRFFGDSNASSSVGSASNMAFTASTNDVGAKSMKTKAAKSAKSSKSKSSKTLPTTTTSTSTTTAGTTTAVSLICII